MAIYELAIMREENGILRETNYKLSKRRRLKNKRLQNEKVLLIKDGQRLMAEKEGNGLQSQSTAAEGSNRQRGRPKGRRCGVCGEPGHNARTCDLDVELDSEEESD